jgi:hypothetical protein
MIYKIRTTLILSTAALGITAGGLFGQNTIEKVLVGDTTVTLINGYKGTQLLPKPVRTVVYSFNVPADLVTLDHSPAARILSHDPIAHMKGDAGRNDSQDSVASHVQAAFSEKLVQELNKTSIPAVSPGIGGTDNPPVSTLVVRGDFTGVKLGNETKRMMIGFGRGASDVKAHAIVSLITGGGPILLAEFDLKSESGKKPGAAATMGVGSAAGSVAASAVVDGKATVEGDASRMAKAVAKQIESIMVAQQWVVAGPQR